MFAGCNLVWEHLKSCPHASFEVARAIMAEAALSFLGLGVQPPTASWGNMLMDAQTYIWNAPLLVVLPGLCIFATVVAFSMIGEGIRTSLDPTLITR